MALLTKVIAREFLYVDHVKLVNPLPTLGVGISQCVVSRVKERASSYFMSPTKILGFFPNHESE